MTVDEVGTLPDSVGNTIRLGTWVAYVSRYGSTVNIERRKVIGVSTPEGDYILLEPLSEGSQSGRVKPGNCVVLP